MVAPPAEPVDVPDGPRDDAEGRGESATDPRPSPARTRKRRPAPSGKLKARNIHLTDDVHDRAWQLARQRKTTVSAVINEALDKTLPRWRIEREA